MERDLKRGWVLSAVLESLRRFKNIEELGDLIP